MFAYDFFFSAINEKYNVMKGVFLQVSLMPSAAPACLKYFYIEL